MYKHSKHNIRNIQYTHTHIHTSIDAYIHLYIQYIIHHRQQAIKVIKNKMINRDMLADSVSIVYMYIAQGSLHLYFQLLRSRKLIVHIHFLDKCCTYFLFIACCTWPLVETAHDCVRCLSLTGLWPCCRNCPLSVLLAP